MGTLHQHNENERVATTNRLLLSLVAGSTVLGGAFGSK
jgi:hypothetical protein